MNRSILKLALIAAAIVALVVILSAPAFSSVYGKVSGTVLARQEVVGASGKPSAIVLTINTGDGKTWLVACRRQRRNLALCASVREGALIVGAGAFTDRGLMEPDSLGVKPTHVKP